MLNETDFNARLEAAVALRKEREGREERTGIDHRKDKSSSNNNDKKKKKKKKEKQVGKYKRKPAFAKQRDQSGNLDEGNSINHVQDGEETVDVAMQEDDVKVVSNEETSETMQDGEGDGEEEEDEVPPEVNPCQSLFDNHISSSPSENLSYMQQHYSFYLPDMEYLTDLEGFLGYSNEKVRWGNMCLYCQKTFKSAESVLKHMTDKEHCKILYERGVDQEEYNVFYDFTTVNKEYLGEEKKNGDGGGEGVGIVNEEVANAVLHGMDGEKDVIVDGDNDEEEWEDVSDEEEEDASMKEEDDDDDDEFYDAYQEEIASHGFDITPLGELIFPDGRIVGHRGLARYYKQRFAPDRMERAAVRHARSAAGDRVYNGRVINLYQMQEYQQKQGDNNDGEAAPRGSSTALAIMGRMAGSVPTGRNGKGILVSGEGKGGFTSLSLYRYRAAVKKQRKEDARGQRLQLRSRMNMNRMDKKANNKMTGVCTALAPR